MIFRKTRRVETVKPGDLLNGRLVAQVTQRPKCVDIVYDDGCKVTFRVGKRVHVCAGRFNFAAGGFGNGGFS